MSRQTLWAAAAAVVVVALGAAGGIRAHRAATLPAGHVEAGLGDMSPSDYERFTRLETRTEATGRISDADLDWLIRLMAARPPVANAVNDDIVHDYVMRVFRAVKPVPPPQEEKMYRAVFPLLSSDRFRQRAVAARVMGTLGDRRALPALRRLRNDPDPAVRVAAGKSLRDMGLS